ncbi:MAG: hypothetical protein LBG45_01445 [Dysgonamonadaceae bacterium]|jgi:hypothetical protein|nr:hypothetical protein [Dysgonamonadaceae bacterium]
MGGILVDIANLQAINNEVEILIINSDIEQSLLATLNKNIKVRRINCPARSRNPFYIMKLNVIIAFSNADIFHFHQDNLINYILVRVLKRNLCLTVHCVTLDIKCIHKYDYVFAISEAVKESVKRKTGIDAWQTHLNSLGFSINNYYSIRHRVFFLSHFSFLTVHV